MTFGELILANSSIANGTVFTLLKNNTDRVFICEEDVIIVKEEKGIIVCEREDDYIEKENKITIEEVIENGIR